MEVVVVGALGGAVAVVLELFDVEVGVRLGVEVEVLVVLSRGLMGGGRVRGAGAMPLPPDFLRGCDGIFGCGGSCAC